MSQRRNHNPGHKNCMCNKCGNEAHAKPNSQHRRCPGQEGAVRPKHDCLPSGQRGLWQ